MVNLPMPISANDTLFRPVKWHLAYDRTIELGPRSIIMGIMNITPDSFSDGALVNTIDQALRIAESMISQGADILDVGGESTRPGANFVSPEIEQSRVIPVIEALKSNFDILISIDTYRAQTAHLAISAGAHIINDVWGLHQEPEMANVAADLSAGLCLMHNARNRRKDIDVIRDQYKWFEDSLKIAQKADISPHSIVLDPGFGFGKETCEENMALLSRFPELHKMNYPVLVGTSRKRFIGSLTGKEAVDRDVGTLATSVLLRQMGASVFRVHNVGVHKDALAVIDGLIAHEQDHEQVKIENKD